MRVLHRTHEQGAYLLWCTLLAGVPVDVYCIYSLSSWLRVWLGGRSLLLRSHSWMDNGLCFDTDSCCMKQVLSEHGTHQAMVLVVGWRDESLPCHPIRKRKGASEHRPFFSKAVSFHPFTAPLTVNPRIIGNSELQRRKFNFNRRQKDQALLILTTRLVSPLKHSKAKQLYSAFLCAWSV